MISVVVIRTVIPTIVPCLTVFRNFLPIVFTSEDFEIPQDIPVINIELSEVQLSAHRVSLLMDAISKCQHLKELSICKTSTDRPLDSYCAELIVNIHSIPALSIIGPLEFDELAILREALKKTTFKKLQFFRTEFLAEQLVYICDGLKENTSTKYVDLNQSYFGNEGCKMIADLLKVNKTISYLDLTQSMISDCKDLFEVLKTNTTLRELSLFGNSFDPAQLGALLNQNHSLKYLNLCLAGIRSELSHISEAIVGHQSLRELWMLYNNFDEAGLSKFVECMRDNYSIVDLQVTDSNATDNYNAKLIQELEEITARNRRMQCDNYSNTVIFIRGLVRNKHVLDILPVEIWTSIIEELKYPGIDFDFLAHFKGLYNQSLHKMDES